MSTTEVEARFEVDDEVFFLRDNRESPFSVTDAYTVVDEVTGKPQHFYDIFPECGWNGDPETEPDSMYEVPHEPLKKV